MGEGLRRFSLSDREINFRSLTDSIDTSTPMKRFSWVPDCSPFMTRSAG
ncbi:hypothetical protein GQM18_24960 [Escherichia coli]|nr:hypothetical protein [Escherichia coli]